MEFFGISLYGPQNYIKELLKNGYREPTSKKDVKVIMEKVLQNSTFPHRVGYPLYNY